MLSFCSFWKLDFWKLWTSWENCKIFHFSFLFFFLTAASSRTNVMNVDYDKINVAENARARVVALVLVLATTSSIKLVPSVPSNGRNGGFKGLRRARAPFALFKWQDGYPAQPARFPAWPFVSRERARKRHVVKMVRVK